MPTPRTRPLPGLVLTLIAAPTAVWVTLIVVVWVLAATDQEAPFGGFYSIGIALAVTTTLGAFGIWAYDGLRTGQRELLAGLRDMDRTEPLPRVRPQLYVAGTAAVKAPAVEPAHGVVQMPSPGTIAAMRRLAAKVTAPTD